VDTERFDDLVRQLADSTERRTLIRGLFGGALGLLGAGVLLDEDAAARRGGKKKRRRRRRRGAAGGGSGGATGGTGGTGGLGGTGSGGLGGTGGGGNPSVVNNITINIPGVGKSCDHNSDCPHDCFCRDVCCPTNGLCPTDGTCGIILVPKGCPPVTCGCPEGKECKDGRCVPQKESVGKESGEKFSKETDEKVIKETDEKVIKESGEKFAAEKIESESFGLSPDRNMPSLSPVAGSLLGLGVGTMHAFIRPDERPSVIASVMRDDETSGDDCICLG
jgi:hypothetical protein